MGDAADVRAARNPGLAHARTSRTTRMGINGRVPGAAPRRAALARRPRPGAARERAAGWRPLARRVAAGARRVSARPIAPTLARQRAPLGCTGRARRHPRSVRPAAARVRDVRAALVRSPRRHAHPPLHLAAVGGALQRPVDRQSVSTRERIAAPGGEPHGSRSHQTGRRNRVRQRPDRRSRDAQVSGVLAPQSARRSARIRSAAAAAGRASRTWPAAPRVHRPVLPRHSHSIAAASSARGSRSRAAARRAPRGAIHRTAGAGVRGGRA